ncbi:MAG: A/G-specific adenine glycosylase [Clostridiales bacterium]|nr:A/G-specific adenine glycosylase [Clostridiales bacterium]
MTHNNYPFERMTAPLLSWYEENARTLPWRSDPTPYHVWLSEIMLQQTRVEAVKEYYHRFLASVPDIATLACVPEERLMKLWEGLGYYNRARNLKKAAGIIMEQHDGIFPSDYDSILSLPGIGSYTAGAISSIAFSNPVPAVDGNVLRVTMRLSGSDADISSPRLKKEMEKRLKPVIPKECPGKFNQAIMDLGATTCVPNGAPACVRSESGAYCPLSSMCEAYNKNLWSSIPYKSPKKPRKIQDRTIVILEYENRYSIIKRPEKGLLAGLWEFPSIDCHLSPDELDKRLEQEALSIESIQLLGDAKHIFSHIEWHMLGYLVHLKNNPDCLTSVHDMTFATRKELSELYALPNAFSFYQKQLNE